jgi:DNA (cytosine-5)-methyltransferase 1
MENVPQLLGTAEHDAIEETARHLGFRVSSAKLVASDFGAPQRRARAFIVGIQGLDPQLDFPPRKTHYDRAKPPQPELIADHYISAPEPGLTVRDAIGDLPPPKGTEIRHGEGSPLNLHFGRSPTPKSLARYRAIPKEGMNRFDLLRAAPEITPDCWVRKTSGGTDLFGRLWWDRPSFTIRTEFYKPEKGRYLHPEQHRPITHREAARFQTFPDSFEFVGSKIEIARQIGNAVPPVLAARVADSVYALLSQT